MRIYQAGNVTTSDIACWDGQSFSSLQNGIEINDDTFSISQNIAEFIDLQCWGNYLFVAGDLIQVNNTYQPNIVRWDISQQSWGFIEPPADNNSSSPFFNYLISPFDISTAGTMFLVGHSLLYPIYTHPALLSGSFLLFQLIFYFINCNNRLLGDQ